MIKLAESGNFALAVTLAKKASEKLGTESSYTLYMEQILCDYLVPLAVLLSRPTPTNAKKGQIDSEKLIFDSDQPSVSFLTLQLSSIDPISVPLSDEWRPSVNNL